MRKLVALFLVLLPVLAFATVPPSQDFVKPGQYGSIFDLPFIYEKGQPSELVWFVAPALLVCIGFTVLAYMAGEAMEMPTIKAFAKNEVLELGNTIVIFVFIVAALGAFSLAAERMYPNITYTNTSGEQLAHNGECGYYYDDPQNPLHKPTMFSMADYFLGCQPYWDAHQTGDGGVLLPRLVEIYGSLMQLETILGILSTLGAQVNLPQASIMLPSVSISFHAGLTVVSEAHTVIVDMIGLSIVTVVGQKVLLEFVYASVLKYFLPFGILLRAIPITRKTGSTVIAVCLVFYFVYPASIMINKYIFDTYVTMGTYAPGDTHAEQMPYTMIGKRVDFIEYQNALQMCQAAQTEDPAAIEKLWDKWGGAVDSLEKTKNEIYFTPSGDVLDNTPSYKGVERAGFKQRFLYSFLGVVNAVFNVDKIGGLFAAFMPAQLGAVFGPPALGTYFYDAITDELTVATQFLTWNFIFIVISIVITLTLFKDISMAIGGETRIFGITKLV
ncbi:Uncharacterised protein [Candidatus Anstonella stagnisolia]|nr:Uncharacterised protein [Candidatus Anstonella stagnisolia]